MSERAHAGLTVQQGYSVGSPNTPAAPPRETVTARLDHVNVTLEDCESLAYGLMGKVAGPMTPAQDADKAAGPPLGLAALAMAIGARAQRLREALEQISAAVA